MLLPRSVYSLHFLSLALLVACLISNNIISAQSQQSIVSSDHGRFDLKNALPEQTQAQCPQFFSLGPTLATTDFFSFNPPVGIVIRFLMLADPSAGYHWIIQDSGDGLAHQQITAVPPLQIVLSTIQGQAQAPSNLGGTLYYLDVVAQRAQNATLTLA